MAKPAKTDRQAVIDEMRKKQKSAEKRRGYAIVAVCVTIALVMIGAAAYKPVKDWWDGRALEGVALNDIGAAASTCEDIITKKADGNQNHVPVDTPVDYKQAPPAFGPHWNQAGLAPAPFARKLYTSDDRPELEALVHNLEHGYTIVWYDQSIADDDDAMTDLRALAAKFPGTTNLRHKFIAAPWTSKDEGGATFPGGAHVAFSHWSKGGAEETDTTKQVGVWQYCSEFSGEALETYMLDYPYLDSPEPTVP